MSVFDALAIRLSAPTIKRWNIDQLQHLKHHTISQFAVMGHSMPEHYHCKTHPSVVEMLLGRLIPISMVHLSGELIERLSQCEHVWKKCTDQRNEQILVTSDGGGGCFLREVSALPPVEIPWWDNVTLGTPLMTVQMSISSCCIITPCHVVVTVMLISSASVLLH